MRVHPGAGRTKLVGWMEDGALKLAVAEAPEGGRANRAVVGLIAKALGLPARQVAVSGGSTSRRKWIDVDGLDRAELARRIDRALSQGSNTDAE